MLLSESSGTLAASGARLGPPQRRAFATLDSTARNRPLVRYEPDLMPEGAKRYAPRAPGRAAAAKKAWRLEDSIWAPRVVRSAPLSPRPRPISPVLCPVAATSPDLPSVTPSAPTSP